MGIGKMCIPVLLFVYACNSKPDLSEHKKKVANEVVKCTKDEIKSTTNTFIPGLGILASNLIDGSINDDNVKNMFFRNNSLELKDSWFGIEVSYTIVTIPKELLSVLEYAVSSFRLSNGKTSN